MSGELKKLFILFCVISIYFIQYFLYSIVLYLYIEGELGKVSDTNHRIYIHAPHVIVSAAMTNAIKMLCILLKI